MMRKPSSADNKDSLLMMAMTASMTMMTKTISVSWIERCQWMSKMSLDKTLRNTTVKRNRLLILGERLETLSWSIKRQKIEHMQRKVSRRCAALEEYRHSISLATSYIMPSLSIRLAGMTSSNLSLIICLLRKSWLTQKICSKECTSLSQISSIHWLTTLCLVFMQENSSIV